ncbi:MAG TPA: SMP-30/gluconolactonase/LRE family protein [Sphingomonas sp.]|uniref:SMP-30/gluconolactonase/LRE family protein n=1 Tax=Sphingomonas sp. TaxID=28214 RepID=UPI002CD223D0|nr:SMP-30/gluconolactonase/LRE family protein [Sphingomonas sp.]HMI19726.1 SMP-30/gluconolactonase/LRE family protein [Sphingomonas sp.]
MNKPKRLLAGGDIVGESAVWNAARQELLWVDIVGRRIQTLNPATGEHRVWRTADLVTSIGLCRTGHAIVGQRSDVALWDFEDNFERLAAVEPALPDNRLNEGCVGPDGAFWVGTMQDNIARDGSPKPMNRNSGAFYRISADGNVDQITPRDFGICNTMAWDDQGRFLCADTLANTLYAFDYADGRLSNRRLFATHARGLPDGSALDAEGYLWNARVGGGCIVRFAPDGSVAQVIDLPCAAPTSCTFGGPEWRTLFVTSARFGLPEDRKHGLDEGAIFAIETDVAGRPAYLFG